MPDDLLVAVRLAWAAGLCVLPVRPDGSKAPDVATWTAFKHTRPTLDQMKAFDFATRVGYGVIAGPVSGHLDPWDFDDRATFDQFVITAETSGLGDVVRRIRNGYEDTSPGGGVRWLARYDAAATFTDTILARRPWRDGDPSFKQASGVITLIEITTFSILAPSNGATHPSGRPYVHVSGGFSTIARYTVEERAALFDLARSFDEMPRRPHESTTAARTEPSGRRRPGDDYNQRATWPSVLEPAGWRYVSTRGDVAYWRRPGKTAGVSATTNYGGADLFYVFTSATAFDPERSYSKFAVYTVLQHGGDFAAAARALSHEGYGRPDDPAPTTPPDASTADPTVCPVCGRDSCTDHLPPTPLAATVSTFTRWLCLTDPIPLYAIAATLVANRAIGDPIWLLLVCAPSSGKTELLTAATGLKFVVSAAKVTEASLLSGTSARERNKHATGGLLRQIGDFGVLLCKDFGSVLSQHYDTRSEAMAALREIYDGEWHRPVGTDGGKVLTWRGKCGVIGGVTPALDQHAQVMAALGDRFVLLRLPEADVEAFGAAALHHGAHEQRMRDALRAALAGLVQSADPTRVHRAFTHDEEQKLIRLAAFTARARTAVGRDGYSHEITYLPQVEGPGRLVKAYARLLGALEAIGCDPDDAWQTITRMARDSVPALRLRVIRELLAHETPTRTAAIAAAIQTATKTAARHLEDLSILKIAVRSKLNDKPNSPDLWIASAWLRQYFPSLKSDSLKSESDKSIHQPDPDLKEVGDG
ncbi:MAG TPA: hypothetical protein VGF24_33130 [Vicinamibacterales bacterium]|jgi:hypothetical protein